jgi:predicted ATPase
MKIIELEIEGFRSFKHVVWRPGDLNIVIGPNASGKSNLLRFFEMLSASAKGKLGDYVQNAGGMAALAWDGAVERIVATIVARASDGADWTYRLGIGGLGTGGWYMVDSELLDIAGPAAYAQRIIQRSAAEQLLFDDHGHLMELGTQQPVPIAETLLSAATYIAVRCRLYFEAWTAHQDVITSASAPIRQAPVARYEKQVAPDGQNLINVLHTLYTESRDFQADVDLAMQAAFGDDYDGLVFPPVASQRIEMQVRWKSLSRACPAADLSDGTLRFLFLIAVLANPEPPPLIAIDEPETGLHPSMLPIVAEYAADAALRTQIVLTTHSPEFLDAFSELDRTVTVADWTNGETTLRTLDSEALQYWLNEYTLGALYRSGELEHFE